MSTAIIITICTLLLLAYVFDISSSKTKIPSAILLLMLGFFVKQISTFFSIEIPNLTSILPILGTIGLILIVLEGSLELELNASKKNIIAKSTIVALAPLLLLSFGLAYAFQLENDCSYKINLTNAIPFAIISSAIAIPSVHHLLKPSKEFVTYETSLSDIFGVIFFNFILFNTDFGMHALGHFLLELFIILLVSFLSTLGLSYLLHRIKHHIKYTPIILLIVLIYAISKIYHLPSLLFILILGLFFGNIDELRQFKFIQQFHPVNFSKEISNFKELTSEMTFLIRALFFLLFGFLIEASEIFNSVTILWATGITISLFLIRLVFLKFFKLDIKPLLYIAPRGLITILLFLSIPPDQNIGLVNRSLVIQVIILTALVMMFGLLNYKKPIENNSLEQQSAK